MTLPDGAPLIRPAGAGDVPALRRVLRAAFAPWAAAIGRPPAPMLADPGPRVAAGGAWALDLASPDLGRSVEGVLLLVPEPRALLLDAVAVHPAHQGRGHGRALLLFAEGEARARGLPELRLYTNARMEGNVALYRRLGYEVTDRRTEDGFDRVFLRKRLVP